MRKLIKEAFDKIRVNEDLKDKTYTYVLRHTKKPLYPKLVLSFGVFVIALIATYYIYFFPTSFISFDINPSLELVLNRFDRVIDIKAYNRDAEDLVSEISYFGNDYNEVLKELIATNTVQKCLSNDEVLSITLISDDDLKKEYMESSIEDYTDEYENIHCHKYSSEHTKEAHHHKMSSGKYQYYLLLREKGYDLDIDEVNSMTIKEILKLLGEDASFDSHHGNHH